MGDVLLSPESLVPLTLHEHACDLKFDWQKRERVGQKCNPEDRHIRTVWLKSETPKPRLSSHTRRNNRAKPPTIVWKYRDKHASVVLTCCQLEGMIVDTDATRALRVGVDESVRLEKLIELSNLAQNLPFQGKALPFQVSRQLGKLDGEV